MPVEIKHLMPDGSKTKLSNIVGQYKQDQKEWQDWAAGWHEPQEKIIVSFGFNYLIRLFKQRCARTRHVPESIITSLDNTIKGRKRAKLVYEECKIPDAGRHEHPIQQLEEIYALATGLQSTLDRDSSESVKPTVPSESGSDMQGPIEKPIAAAEASTPESSSIEVSVLPGLLMDEIIKSLEEIRLLWQSFFQSRQPCGDIVSNATVTSAADDCLRSLTYEVELFFTPAEKDEFKRLAKKYEEQWAAQWSVKRVHGVADPMNESAYKEELSKNNAGLEFMQQRWEAAGKNKNRKARRRQTRGKNKNKKADAHEADYTTEPIFKLTDTLSHKSLSAAIFVPMPNGLIVQAPSKLDQFRNVMTIHLWHLAAINLGNNGTDEEGQDRSFQTTFRIIAIIHTYARSYQIWLANKSIRDIALQVTSSDILLERIDHAIESCHERFIRWPNLMLNPWLIGYLVAVHHGTSELYFRRFVATNYVSRFGFLASQFGSTQVGRTIYPRLWELTRDGQISGSASIIGALFGHGHYQRTEYRPSSHVRTLGVEFLKDINTAALLKRHPVDWWLELAASRSLLCSEPGLDHFDIFEHYCRQYEEIFAIPRLQFGFPFPNASGIDVTPINGDRIYQRQWAQELRGNPDPKYQTSFEHHSEEALMKLIGITLPPLISIVEYQQRAENCPLFDECCVEYVIYTANVGQRGFAYRLGEPVRIGENFQSLRTATYLSSDDKVRMTGIVQRSRDLTNNVLEFLRGKNSNTVLPLKELVSVDSTFAHSNQPHLCLYFDKGPGPVPARPSRFLLAPGILKVVLKLGNTL